MRQERIAGGGHAVSEREREIFPPSLSKTIGTLAIAAALFAVPATARAECELTPADVAHGAAGIPEDAVMPIDAFGIRRGLARNGIEVGGYYYGETF